MNKKNKLYYQVKKSVDLSKLPEIRGYDFEKLDYDSLLDSFNTTGLQATELGKAIAIAKAVEREDIPLYLSFTSNMVSSGVRESIKYLVKHKKVKVIVTAAGGVEEDIIKSKSPFRIGNFDVKGATLFDSGVSRIGNIFATNEHYTYLEFFLRKVFEKAKCQKLQNKNDESPISEHVQEQKFSTNEKTKDGYCIVSPSELIFTMGKIMDEEKEYDKESSIVYWAYKNNIPIYCPGIVDGAIGDMLYFYKKNNKNFIIDPTLDHEKIIDYTINQEKTAAIMLGGGISKHYTLNANIFKEGFDYAIYINTAQGFDGSDSGGDAEEAISWAKIKTNAMHAKVNCDASIAFPLLVAKAFASKHKK